jgi:predicted TPR repeat methyltransferase
MGRSDEAVGLIEQAILVEPDFAGYHNNLGNILASTGQLDQATAVYERALVLDPQDPDLHCNLGSLYRSQQLVEPALQSYQRALRLNENHVQAHNNLGLLYADQGDRPRAIQHYLRALEQMPGNPSARKLLGTTYYALGRIEDAAEVYRQWLQIEPDQPMARHMLSACTGVNVPDRAADDYVEQTFDHFAASFEEVLNERLEYRAPALCAAALAEYLPAPQHQCMMLDAGCGTGLCGPLMAPWASTLAGVDLSRGMLDRAASKGVYDDLYKAELTEFLEHSVAQWDVILSADTLCYFGDLQRVMRAAALALRPGGVLAYTVEALMQEEVAGTQVQAPDCRIQPHGRYAHARQHLCTTLASAGLSLRIMRAEILRTEGGRPVQGWLVLATK